MKDKMSKHHKKMEMHLDKMAHHHEKAMETMEKLRSEEKMKKEPAILKGKMQKGRK